MMNVGSVGHLDLLEALDRATRGAVGDIATGYDVYLLALRDRLVANADQATVARWVGDLVSAGYVEPLSSQGGQEGLPPRGVPWTDRELQAFLRYTVTAPGRTEADRVRRLRREQQTDATLGARYPVLAHSWLQPSQREALARHLRELGAALDDERAAAAVGAAKDLVEAALRMAIFRRTGQQPSPRTSLPSLVSAVLPQTDSQAPELPGVRQIARSLAAATTALAELRNIAGTGHGRAEPVDVELRQARLAGSAACAVAEFVLASQDSIDGD